VAGFWPYPFVGGRDCWKSLPGENTLAYYENIIAWKKFVSVTKALASYYVIFSTIIECFRARKKPLKFKFRRKYEGCVQIKFK